MRDMDPTHCSYPGGVKAAENHGVPNDKGGAMKETGGGDTMAKGKSIGKSKGKKALMKKEAAEGKKVHSGKAFGK